MKQNPIKQNYETNKKTPRSIHMGKFEQMKKMASNSIILEANQDPIEKVLLKYLNESLIYRSIIMVEK